MKLLALGLAIAAAAADTLPRKINFQGKLVDPATNQPRNGAIAMQFRVYGSASGGSALYTETQTVNVANGVFSVQIGSVTALTRDLFLGASAYLGITVPPDAEMTPRHQLVMSPYAFTASQVATSSDLRLKAGVSYSTFTTAGNLLVPEGIVASTGSFTATGASVYSLSTSSSVLIGGNAEVAGTVHAGLYYRNVNQNNANCRAACTTPGTAAISGGCLNTGTLQIRRSFPSVEATDGTTIGTAVGDGESHAGSWTCVFSGANAANRCFVVCARVGA